MVSMNAATFVSLSPSSICWHSPACSKPNRHRRARQVGTGAPNALTGEIIDTAEVLRLGYALDVVPHEELFTGAMSLANQIATGPPHGLRVIKSLVHGGLTASVSEHTRRHTESLAACLESDEHREGVAAFTGR
ncbi:MAG: hypothetical protein GKR86_14300 [Ilumatobacter sp.]|nr:hypothetical protein [Ilumatobacter sp.]